MLNITNQQKNENQNHSELSPHTHQQAISKKTANKKYWQGYREKGALCTVGMNVSWRSCYGK